MTDITIPTEALEAAAIEMAPAPWSMYTEEAKEHFRKKARAACLAMLREWPYRMGPHLVKGYTDLPAFILPLTQEPTND